MDYRLVIPCPLGTQFPRTACLLPLSGATPKDDCAKAESNEHLMLPDGPASLVLVRTGPEQDTTFNLHCTVFMQAFIYKHISVVCSHSVATLQT